VQYDIGLMLGVRGEGVVEVIQEGGSKYCLIFETACVPRVS